MPVISAVLWRKEALLFVLNTIATLAFQERLASDLNTLHGLFGLGSLLGPLVLAFGLQFFKSLELSYFVGAGVAAITILLLLLQQLPELARQATNVQQQRAANRERRKVLRQKLLWLMVLQVSIFSAAEIGYTHGDLPLLLQSHECLPLIWSNFSYSHKLLTHAFIQPILFT